ncbi:MAG: DDE-type integrase/transposase/recombinase [Sulfurospirillaceae bacterium]|nr:DDE-type integrase/transposase/recombinase [Sulfurospirillaceae bacterium]
MSWGSSKEAAELLHVNYDALVKAVKRASLKDKKICSLKGKNLHFQHIDGVGGAGGKVLQIWIGEEDDFRNGNGGDERGGIEGISSRPNCNSDDGVIQYGQIQSNAVYRELENSGTSTNGATFESKEASVSTGILYRELQRREGLGEVQEPISADASLRGRNNGDRTAYKKEVIAYVRASSVKAASSYFGESEKNIYRWVNSFSKDGAKALKDKRGANNKKVDDESITHAIYAAGSVHISSMYHVYCMFYAKKNHLPIDMFNPVSDITYSTFYRAYERIKKEDGDIRAYLKRGLDGLDVRPTGKRNYLNTNEEWQIDSTKFDFMALNDLGEAQRYDAISIVDVASKRRVSYLCDTSNSYSIVRLLRKALKRFEKPFIIKGDNGKDYMSEHFQNVCFDLGICYINTAPFAGREKGIVERQFRTIQHSYFETLPGFIGHNVGQRSELEAQALEKSKKLSGVKTSIKNLLTFDELQFMVDAFNEEKFNKGVALPTSNFDERVLGQSKKVRLGQDGLRFNTFTYMNLELFKHGSVATTYFKVYQNIDNLSSVYVYDMEGNFVCEAIDKTIVEISAEEYRAAQKAYKKDKVGVKKAMVKSMTHLKDSIHKEGILRAMGATDAALKESQKTLFKKQKNTDEEVEIKLSVKAGLGNQKTYRPSTDDMEDALRALKG